MTSDFEYDPVTVTDESTATGRTAEIFEDIRQTMNLPLVTSIWRALASWDNCLEETWEAVKPIYTGDLPTKKLEQFVEQIDLSNPTLSFEKNHPDINVNENDIRQIKSIIKTYNKSNGLNFLTLAALISPLKGIQSTNYYSKIKDPKPLAKLKPLANLKPLLSRQAIESGAWAMVEQANRLGSDNRGKRSSSGPHVATLWRHLAHWPNFLRAVHTSYLPNQVSGQIKRDSQKAVETASVIGQEINNIVSLKVNRVPLKAINVITSYVTSPQQVARMVVLGIGMNNWLNDNKRTQ